MPWYILLTFWHKNGSLWHERKATLFMREMLNNVDVADVNKYPAKSLPLCPSYTQSMSVIHQVHVRHTPSPCPSYTKSLRLWCKSYTISALTRVSVADKNAIVRSAMRLFWNSKIEPSTNLLALKIIVCATVRFLFLARGRNNIRFTIIAMCMAGIGDFAKPRRRLYWPKQLNTYTKLLKWYMFLNTEQNNII